jgi:hypothetical protein
MVPVLTQLMIQDVLGKYARPSSLNTNSMTEALLAYA